MAIYHATPNHLAALAAEVDARVGVDEAVQVALTTWETTTLPHAYADAISSTYDEVIVPSKFCLDALTGLNPGVAAMGVHVVPHCFDEEAWPMPAPRPDNMPYRFYSIGQTGARKNMLGVLAAYLHAFTAADPVTLLLVIGGVDRAQVNSLVARSGLPQHALPAFSVIEGGNLPEQDIIDLHAGGDCYVSATRGEGWGLGMFEAAAMGRKVIAPALGGQRDFLQYADWYRVAVMMAPCFGEEARGQVIEREGRLMQTATVSIPPGVDAKQVWYEPVLTDLARGMRLQMQPYPCDPDNQAFQRQQFEYHFSYRAVGPRLVNTLKEIIES